MQETGLLTAKRIIYCANIDEATLASGGANRHTEALAALARERGAGFLAICAKIEEEMRGLSELDRAEMLASYGIGESGLDAVIRAGYAALGLISYFTAGEKEVKAWTIPRGFKAPQAAGVIHSDFERGFIRAEVIAYDEYSRLGSEAAARSAGLLRVEGRDYVVNDGDVMHFLFNV
jgi:ribosome-binding ATPase YchF (GTP1/OBG family)